MIKYRWLWAITLLFYFSGCTVYVPAYLPGENMPEPPSTQGKTGYSPGVLPDDPIAPNPEKLPPAADRVRVGLNIRLTMVNGETVSGTVVELNEEALAFGKPSNYGLKLDHYSFADIEKIEVSHSTGLTKLITVSVLVLTSLAILFVLGMAHSMDSN